MEYIRRGIAGIILNKLNRVSEESFDLVEAARKDSTGIQGDEDMSVQIQKALEYRNRQVARLDEGVGLVRIVLKINNIVDKLGFK